MKNNRLSIFKIIKEKIPNTLFSKVFGRLSIACIFLWYANNTYKRMQFKHEVADLQVIY
jgi:hypothetical protein